MADFERSLNLVCKLIRDPAFQQDSRLGEGYFTRKRVFTFEKTAFTVLSLSKKGLQADLNITWQECGQGLVFTKQAFSKARQKISEFAFRAINRQLVFDYYANAKYQLFHKKYILLAVDGSTLHLPNNEAVVAHFGLANNATSGTPTARISILYDVLNKVIIDAKMESYNTSEKDMFLELFQVVLELKEKTNREIVLLFDRHYPCCGLFLLLAKHRIHFVCRSHTKINQDLIAQSQPGKLNSLVWNVANNTNKRRVARTWLGIPQGVEIIDNGCSLSSDSKSAPLTTVKVTP